MAVAPAVYGFSFGAALFLGLGPVFSKHGLALGGTWMQNVLVVLLTRTGLLWIGLLALAGADALAGMTYAAAAVFVLGGVLASGFGRVAFAIGNDRVGSSLSNAFANTRPVFAVLLAVGWLGETVTPGMGAGVLVLVVGLVVLSLSRGGDVTGWRRVDLGFPLLAAVAFAAGNVVRRFGFVASDVSVWQAVAVGEAGSLVAMVGFAAATGRLRLATPTRRVHASFAAAGVAASVGLLALFAALRSGPVSVVDPVAATAPLVTIAFAGLLLRDVERVTGRLVAGVALVVAGVAVLTVAAA